MITPDNIRDNIRNDIRDNIRDKPSDRASLVIKIAAPLKHLKFRTGPTLTPLCVLRLRNGEV